MAELRIEPGGSASVYVLHEGYVGRDGDDERVAGTVTLIVDGDAVIVVDPGMVASREALLAALAAHGPQAGDVTDVVFSHHHPDHTVNAALFPTARIHDHWAVYVGDRWIDRDANGAELGRPSGCCARRGTPPRTCRMHARDNLHYDGITVERPSGDAIMRLIAAVRLSRLSDSTTSVDTQAENLEEYARRNGHKIVKVTSDLDVSGGKPIMKRPGVGPWFDRMDEWDALAGYSIDRMFRNHLDFLKTWHEVLEPAGKLLIAVNEKIDMTTFRRQDVRQHARGVRPKRAGQDEGTPQPGCKAANHVGIRERRPVIAALGIHDAEERRPLDSRARS